MGLPKSVIIKNSLKAWERELETNEYGFADKAERAINSLKKRISENEPDKLDSILPENGNNSSRD